MALSALSLGAVLLHASLGRPIWIDEFLHFALGGYRSTREAWRAIGTTVVTFNHGQTGAYMVADYWLLRIFGASTVALRLPSLLSGLLLFASAIAIMRFRGFGLAWQVLVIVALLGQGTLMYFIGEARPYMSLAAASVGTLAYYLAPDRQRRWALALGVPSILLGALMHPYFSVYWLVLFLFAHALAVFEGEAEARWSSLLRHVSLPLSAVGLAIYVGLARSTWLRGGPAFGLDPFQWIAADGLYRSFFGVSHLQFAGASWPAVLALVSATPVLALVLPSAWRTTVRPLVAPAVLFLLAIAVSVLLAVVSYRRGYWILPRQWVASMAIVPVAVVWFWGEWARALERRAGWLGVSALALAFLVLGWTAYPGFRESAAALASHAARNAKSPPAQVALRSIDISQGRWPTDNDGWVALANENVQAGGAVWPVFRKFYGD